MGGGSLQTFAQTQLYHPLVCAVRLPSNVSHALCLPLVACCTAQGGESELDQVEQELSSSNTSGSKRSLSEDDKKSSKAIMRLLYMLFSPVFLKAFTLTFLAEWGDRSQIATIG